MEPIALILEVLVAGTAISSQATASQVIKDAYQGLKKLIQQKLGDQADSELVLTKFDEQPEVWQIPLKDMLMRVHVDQDEEIIKAAQRLLAHVDPQQSTMGKYNVHIAGNAQPHRFVIGEGNTIIFQQIDAVFSPFDETIAHTKYLEKLYNRYSTVTLPIGPADGFSLQAIFQPLKLRRDPLAAEDLAHEERRAFLGEPTRSDYDPRYARLISNNQWTGNSEQQEDLVTIANDGNEALIKSPYGRIVVLGAPGTGKTTLLRYLIGQRAQQALKEYSGYIPIFISLPDLARSGRTLREYLIYTVQEMMINERYADVLWKAIVAGRAFICLDSLDEVAPKQRPEKIKLINELAADSGNIWVVGSRFTDYKGGQLGRGQFTEWELQPMNRTLRSELAQRLIPELHRLMPIFKVATREPTVFVNTLEKHPRAAAWGNNPLLFSVAAVVFVRTGMLPSSRTELYKEVIKAVFEFREVGIQPEMLRLVMADLALELYKEKGRTFTRSDLLRLLPYVRKRQNENWNTEEMFNRIVNSGVLEVVAEDTYGFRHQTFQEYLAGVELAQRLVNQDQVTVENAWNLAWDKRITSRWVEVLRLMAGVLSQEFGEEGLKVVQCWLHELANQRTTQEGDPGNLGLELVLKSLSEIGEKERRADCWKDIQGIELERAIVLSWIEELISAVQHNRPGRLQRLEELTYEVSHLSSPVVEEAVKQLVAVLSGERDNKPASINWLHALMYDRQSQLRKTAAKVLGVLGKHIILERLAINLESNDDKVRSKAAEALEDLDAYVPLESLLAGLNHANDRIRQAAKKAIEKALGSTNYELRLAMKRALRNLGNSIPNELLRNALDEEDSYGEGTQVLEDQISIEVPSLSSEQQKIVRGAAASSLEILGELASIELLMSILRDSDIYVRAAAITALGTLGEHTPINLLAELLKDSDHIVRECAARALGGLGERAPIDCLIMALDDTSEMVRYEAMKAIYELMNANGKYRRRVPMKCIEKVIYDEEQYVHIEAVKALITSGKRAPMRLLKEALDTIDWRAQALVIQAFWKLWEYAPTDWFVNVMKDSNRFARANAVKALGNLGVKALRMARKQAPEEALLTWLIEALDGRGIVDWLIEAMNDKDSLTRRAAIQALGKLGEQKLKPLVKALQDEDLWVRSMAAWILLAPRKDGTLDPFIETSFEDRKQWLSVALWILENQKGQGSLNWLVQALGDDDDDIRWAAIQVIGTLGEKAPIDQLMEILGDPDNHVREAVAQSLKLLEDWMPLDKLIIALGDRDPFMRQGAVEALGILGKQISIKPLIAVLGDSNGDVRCVAIETLKKMHLRSDDSLALLSEINAILSGQEGGLVLGSIAQGFVAETIGKMGYASTARLDKLTELLNWPFWEVRMKAAQALGRLRRNIPDTAIRCLYELRHDPQSRAVREAADDALAEILSLETGIEDD